MKVKPTYGDLEKKVETLLEELKALRGSRNNNQDNKPETYSSDKRVDDGTNYRKLFKETLDGLLLLDSKGRITDVSRGTEELYGYSLKEMRGRRLDDFLSPALLPRFKEAFSDFEKMKPADDEMQIIRNDGTLVDIWCKCTPLKDSDGNFEGVLINDREITRIKMLRDQLIRSERLAATGQLAASVAHEINSPLQGVIGLIDVMKNTHAKDDKLLRNLNLLEGAFDSIRHTVRNLLDLNRPGKQILQTVDVNKVIQSTLALVRSNLKKNKVVTRLQLSPGLPGVVTTPQQISQVIMNLINNAIEAINGISRSDEPETSDLKGGTIRFKTYAREKWVVIEVADSGPGIADEDISQVFDPFFTKKKKMGMGVGLSICHGIIEQNRGTILVGNMPDGGAVFTVELPQVESPKKDGG